jgi:hypothetical protein
MRPERELRQQVPRAEFATGWLRRGRFSLSQPTSSGQRRPERVK